MTDVKTGTLEQMEAADIRTSHKDLLCELQFTILELRKENAFLHKRHKKDKKKRKKAKKNATSSKKPHSRLTADVLQSRDAWGLRSFIQAEVDRRLLARRIMDTLQEHPDCLKAIGGAKAIKSADRIVDALDWEVLV